MEQGLRPAGNVPEFVAIADRLHAEIEDGRYPGGARFPSEAELCRRFGQNRYTIRKALDLLVKAGVLCARQGIGHFVCRKPLDVQYTITATMRFSEMMARQGCRPSARLLGTGEAVPPEEVGRALDLAEGERAVHLDILRFADGVPVARNETWLRAELFPGLLRLLNGPEPFHSLHAILLDHYGTRLTRVRSTFRTAHPKAAEAGLLHISPHQNLLVIDSLMKDQRGQPAEFTSARYRGDLCRVTIDF